MSINHWTGLTHCAERLRNHAVPGQSLEVPFGCTFSLPGPEDPAISLLESDELGLDVALDVGAVCIAKVLDRTGVLAITGADVVRTLATLVVGAVIPRADTTTVEPLEALSV